MSRSTGKLYTYDTIPLSVYFDICTSANYALLYKGKVKPAKQYLVIMWEKIIIRSGRETGGLDMVHYFDLLQGYALLYAEYTFVKACLLKLSIKVDFKVIRMLAERGYYVSKENGIRYDESLRNASSKSDNLITRLLAREKQMKEFTDSGGQQKVTYLTAIANLNIHLGFTVGIDITLAEYNEYHKLIKQKHGSGRQLGDNQ